MHLDRYRHWAAKWIWPADGRAVNTHVLFRKDFDVNAAPKSATLFLSVETFARVYFNGREILRTGSLSYPGQQHYEEVDLLPLLKQGTNQLAIVAWYAGIGCTSTWLKDPGLLCEVVLGDGVDGGNATRIASDATWHTLKLDAWTGGSRSRMFNLDLMEILDYRKLPDGFPFPTGDLKAIGFEAPEVLPWAGVRMGVVEPLPFPAPITEGDVPLTLRSATLVHDQSPQHPVPAVAVSHEHLLQAIAFEGTSGTITPPAPGHAVTLVYELNRYEKFFPHIALDAPAGAVVDFSWCEHLTNGHFDARPKHPWVTDRYTLRDGHNVIEPEEWKCGRFVQLTLRNFSAPVRVERVRLIRTRYPLKQRGFFKSSNDKLNRIVAIGLRAAELCMHDRIMDCPWRERRQWIADAQRIALINYYAFDDTRLIRGVLRQHARLQDATGRMWVCIPLMEEYPVQSMEWTKAVVEYAHYTGDTSLMSDLSHNIEWLHRWFLRCRDARGLFFNPHPPVMNWMDNPLGKLLKHQFDTAFCASNLRYLQFLDDVAQVLTFNNRHEGAAEAKRAREELAGRIAANFLDDSTGLLRECADEKLPAEFSELTAALAVRAELPNFDAAAHFDRYTAFAQSNPDRTIASSPFGKLETFEALGQLGRPQAIVDEILRLWGPMVDAGADTAWEWFDRNTSACHGWSGIPIVALLRHVMHVDPQQAGHTRRENVGGVEWMECEVVSAVDEPRAGVSKTSGTAIL